MNVTEKSQEEDPDLRIFELTVATSVIEEHILAKLREIAPKASMSGFRPGKVPIEIVRKNYEGQLTEEILQTLIHEGIDKILKEQNIVPAMDPDIRVDRYVKGKDFNCTIEMVPLPKIELVDFSQFELQRPITTADESQVNDAIHRLQLRQSSTKIIKPRTFKNGDVLEIDCHSENEKGEAIAELSGKDVLIQIGQQHLFPEEIENALLQSAVGSDLSHTVHYPQDDVNKDIAGRMITYHVHIKSLQEQIVPPVDENFAGIHGFSSMEQMREIVKSSLDGEYKRESDEILKKRLLDQLQQKYKEIRVPKKMTQREYSNIWQQYITSRQENTLSAEEAALSEQDAKDLFGKLADRRVLLALVLTSVSRAHNLSISEQELQQAIEHIVQNHPGEAKNIRETYQQTGARQQLQANLTEQKIVRFILDQVTVQDEELSLTAFQEIVRNADALPVEETNQTATANATKEKSSSKKTSPKKKPQSKNQSKTSDKGKETSAKKTIRKTQKKES